MLEDLSWRARCCGELNDGWAEAVLSLPLQISESLADECEAVGEARPPRRVAMISCVHWCCDGSVLLTHHWSSGSRSGLQRATALGVAQRWPALATTAQFAGDLFWLLSQIVAV